MGEESRHWLTSQLAGIFYLVPTFEPELAGLRVEVDVLDLDGQHGPHTVRRRRARRGLRRHLTDRRRLDAVAGWNGKYETDKMTTE